VVIAGLWVVVAGSSIGVAGLSVVVVGCSQPAPANRATQSRPTNKCVWVTRILQLS
jgi:hypothetical protein